jgi:hypothetical protein
LMLQNYGASNTPLQIIAVFHSMAGYMLLDHACALRSGHNVMPLTLQG